MTDYTQYISPYSWRYGSKKMREVWSEDYKRRIWRLIWVSLAEVLCDYGLVRKNQVEDLITHMEEIDIPRALEIESLNHHDLMAEVETYAGQCPIGGGIIHLGATSVDIKDNTTAIQIKHSLDHILSQLKEFLSIIGSNILKFADTPIIAFTHLQPAEPSTLGYRLAQYGQDLLDDWFNLKSIRNQLKGKGFKGAVGTSASYAALVGLDNLDQFESLLSRKLDLQFYDVTTQVYPRKQDFNLINGLAGLGASINKFAFDLRILQSPPIGEISEPFGESQVGSSAMPFKRNPIHAEKINSLARMLAQYPRIAWDNAGFSLLERTLDDSANRRSLLPEAFLISDELLRVAIAILKGLEINQHAISQNMRIYGPFAATERVLMALGKAGANRQKMHQKLRIHALAAWDLIKKGEPNPLIALVSTDPVFHKYLSSDELRRLMDAGNYVGNAPKKAIHVAQKIKSIG